MSRPTHLLAPDMLASSWSWDRPGRFCLRPCALCVPSALPRSLPSLEVTGLPCPPRAALCFSLGSCHHLEGH